MKHPSAINQCGSLLLLPVSADVRSFDDVTAFEGQLLERTHRSERDLLTILTADSTRYQRSLFASRISVEAPCVDKAMHWSH